MNPIHVDEARRDAQLVERRLKYFVWVFAVLFAANVIASDRLARDIFRESSVLALARGAAPQGTTDNAHERIGGKGTALMVLNLPAVVNVGLAVRSQPPALGIGYYPTVILGATYVPFALVTLLFFLVHAPHRTAGLPGLDLKG